MIETDHSILNIRIPHLKNEIIKTFRIKFLDLNVNDVIILSEHLDVDQLINLAKYLDNLYHSEYKDELTHFVEDHSLTEIEYKYYQKLKSFEFKVIRCLLNNTLPYKFLYINLKYENLMIRN